MAFAAEPVDVRIARWPRAFPQYTPGHAERIDSLDEMLATEAPGIVLTGAAYRGIGIPACIGQANQAVESVLA
jgi:protoporphyrinogen/coproporphyrinogen III oxidase